MADIPKWRSSFPSGKQYNCPHPQCKQGGLLYPGFEEYSSSTGQIILYCIDQPCPLEDSSSVTPSRDHFLLEHE
jgi:hypothetical protein